MLHLVIEPGVNIYKSVRVPFVCVVAVGRYRVEDAGTDLGILAEVVAGVQVQVAVAVTVAIRVVARVLGRFDGIDALGAADAALDAVAQITDPVGMGEAGFVGRGAAGADLGGEPWGVAGGLGENLDDAADGVRSIERGGRAAQHLDSLNLR
ncbi:hypothetical protein SDC9_152994 [bioreactor metagenome]|uniref:Uncharacterized protein n=1 Tax=bioreactor metagenome TaxID=1076179 RepID=A0A645EUN7_9ZZZZ